MQRAGTKLSLSDPHGTGRRWTTKTNQLSTQIDALANSAAPHLVQLHAIGTEVVAWFLVTTGITTFSARRTGLPPVLLTPSAHAADRPQLYRRGTRPGGGVGFKVVFDGERRVTAKATTRRRCLDA
jgi:hypothetical protein